MKYLFICLFLVSLFVGRVNAQTWCPPGATWHFTISTGGWTKIDGYSEVKYNDTATIYGKLCQKLSWLEIERYPNIPTASHISNFNWIYTHLEQQVLTYCSGPNRFDTIAIFNAAPGAHWYQRLTAANSVTGTPLRLTVRDTGHAMINGVSLKYLNVGFGDSSTVFNASPNAIYPIYERIGSTFSFLFLYDYDYVLDSYDQAGSFTCYEDDEFPVFVAPGTTCIYNLVGIEEQHQNHTQSFYPNPSTGLFSLKTERECSLLVYSSSGQLIQTLKSDGHVSTLDLSDQPAGIYFVKSNLFDDWQVYKLIKQ